MEELVLKTWSLADLMMEAAGESLFVTVGVVDEDRRLLAWKKGWAGGPPEEESRANRIGPTKALELMVDLSEDFAMTPTGHPFGTGWMGGVRQRHEGVHHVTSGSAWSERCDAQHALVLNYAMRQEVCFHHVGYRHPTNQLMLEAIKADEQKLATGAIPVPADDHQRYYIPVATNRAPNGVFWIEHQFFPEGPYSYAVHWDLVTISALDLLEFVASGLGVQAKTWDAGPNDPEGMTWEPNRDGVPFGIMVRSRWWDVGK